MCHWEKLPDGTKFWYPDCMGGAVYGKTGCTCPSKPRKKSKTKIQELEDRIKNLEDIVKEIQAGGNLTTTRKGAKLRP